LCARSTAELREIKSVWKKIGIDWDHPFSCNQTVVSMATEEIMCEPSGDTVSFFYPALYLDEKV